MWYLVRLVSWVAIDTEDAGLERPPDWIYCISYKIRAVIAGLALLSDKSSELSGDGEGEAVGRMPPAAKVMNGGSAITGCWVAVGFRELFHDDDWCCKNLKSRRERGVKSTRLGHPKELTDRNGLAKPRSAVSGRVKYNQSTLSSTCFDHSIRGVPSNELLA